MAKLKGLKKIDKIINDFTKENFGVRADLHKEFLAYCGAKRIGYTLAAETEDINFFLEDAQARFPEIHADPFLMVSYARSWSLYDRRHLDRSRERTY